VVHDGPAYDAEAGLTAYLAGLVSAGELPALRVALLEAGPRNLWYTANSDYATAMADDVLPFLRERWPTTRAIGMGASLGGLAWLHAQSSYPEVVDGLFLQSGSYFRPDTDAQESGFAEFPAIVRFVRSVRRGRRPTRPVPTVMTCGEHEENLANNRRMARVLTRLGYRVRFRAVDGGHDYPSWRAAFDPHLPDLVRAVLA
jgi:enterochelin esterase family protein